MTVETDIQWYFIS